MIGAARRDDRAKPRPASVRSCELLFMSRVGLAVDSVRRFGCDERQMHRATRAGFEANFPEECSPLFRVRRQGENVNLARTDRACEKRRRASGLQNLTEVRGVHWSRQRRGGSTLRSIAAEDGREPCPALGSVRRRDTAESNSGDIFIESRHSRTPAKAA